MSPPPLAVAGLLSRNPWLVGAMWAGGGEGRVGERVHVCVRGEGERGVCRGERAGWHDDANVAGGPPMH